MEVTRSVSFVTEPYAYSVLLDSDRTNCCKVLIHYVNGHCQKVKGLLHDSQLMATKPFVI
jgi:hypothetical protein